MVTGGLLPPAAFPFSSLKNANGGIGTEFSRARWTES